MAKRGNSVLELCAQLLLFIAPYSASGNNKPGDNKVGKDRLLMTNTL